MTIYEVNLSIQREVETAFRQWLNKHVAEMLQIEGFESAKVYEVEAANTETFELCVHYQVRDRELLENYFNTHASRMRADGIKHFSHQFSASRRILN